MRPHNNQIFDDGTRWEINFPGSIRPQPWPKFLWHKYWHAISLWQIANVFVRSSHLCIQGYHNHREWCEYLSHFYSRVALTVRHYTRLMRSLQSCSQCCMSAVVILKISELIKRTNLGWRWSTLSHQWAWSANGDILNFMRWTCSEMTEINTLVRNILNLLLTYMLFFKSNNIEALRKHKPPPRQLIPFLYSPKVRNSQFFSHEIP